MHYETSKLDANEGIAYRGKSLREVQKQGPAAIPGGEPIPEGVLWLLLTGEFPSASEIKHFKEEIFKRGALTAEQEKLIKNLPKDMHAMTQLSAGILMCQPSSHFAKAY
jgi:citrate synthase